MKKLETLIVLLALATTGACSKMPSCSDANVTKTVAELQGQVMFNNYLTSTRSVSQLGSLAKETLDAMKKYASADSGTLSEIRTKKLDKETKIVSCEANIVLSTDWEKHRKEWASVKPTLKATGTVGPQMVENFDLVVHTDDLVDFGKKNTEKRAISYTAQIDDKGEVYVETVPN